MFERANMCPIPRNYSRFIIYEDRRVLVGRSTCRITRLQQGISKEEWRYGIVA